MSFRDLILGAPRSRQTRLSLDATKTDRLNAAHWADAKDEPINVILGRELPELRARAAWERLNNPIVKGVVKTYGDDLAGPAGPRLTVQSDNDRFNSALEREWRDWWAMPDINGQLSGTDFLRMSNGSVWTAGDYLWQIVSDLQTKGPVAARLLMIHSRRLETPLNMVTDDDVVLGVKRNRTGRPLGYYIREAERLGHFAMNYSLVPAANMIHGFERLEPEQVRGFPWLTTCLPVVSEIRDYDRQVLDAARQAAALSVLLYTKNGDGDVTEHDETVELERGMMSTLPPGYEAMQINPSQPSARYAEFRKERLSELGRAVGMPRLTVTLDAAGHSWSSARLDRDVYQCGIRVERGTYNRGALSRLLDIVRREAELSGVLPKRRANLEVKYVWTWPVFSSIDPLKEGKGATERLANGTSSLQTESAALGTDWEEVAAQRARELKKLQELGLAGTREQGNKGAREPGKKREPDERKSPNVEKSKSRNGGS